MNIFNLSFGKDSMATLILAAEHGGEDNPYEAIKVIEAWGLDFCLGNAVKYISRAGKNRKEARSEEKQV